MTQVTTVYNNLVTLVSTALASHKRLSNPYSVGMSVSTQMAKGYGVAIGTAENTNRVISGSATLRREFRIVLSLQCTARETDGSARGTVEKALMEDSITVIKALELDPSLLQSAMNSQYAGDTGIEFIEGATEGSSGFYKTEISVLVEYRESL
jgi:hypothetical protein